MSDMTIQEFCDKHCACAEGRDWAVDNCISMQDAWNKLKPEWMLWVATRNGVLTDKELRLFAVWAARQVQHLMTDPRSIAALDVAERYAHGNASRDELAWAWDAARDAAAWDAAWAAARDAAAAAARDAAWAAARDAAADAARAAARDAAWAAARDAAWAAARDAAADAAWAAARDAQTNWLRLNTAPNFAKEIK